MFNKTPFLIAAKSKYLPIVKVFLDNQRVDFQACSYKILNINIFFNNESALHLAVKSGSVEVVELLLKSQLIDLDIKNIAEMTAFDLAKEKNNEKMIELFNKSYRHRKKTTKK